MWGFHEGMGWWWVFGGVWMVVFWAAVIGLILWVTGQLPVGAKKEGVSGVSKETPMEIAQARLAKGEIDKQQFEELKEALRR